MQGLLNIAVGWQVEVSVRIFADAIVFFCLISVHVNGQRKLKTHVKPGNQDEYQCDLLNILRELSS